MYGEGEYCACMPASLSIAVTASSSARSRSIWRASVQRFSCRSETGWLTVGSLRRPRAHTLQQGRELSRVCKEWRVSTSNLDRLKPQELLRRATAVLGGHHAVVRAKNVGGTDRRQFMERRNFLGHAPVLPAQAAGRIPGDFRLAVVIEDLDRAGLGPRRAPVRVADRRRRGMETSRDVRVLRIEAQSWDGNQGAEVDGHQGWRSRSHDGDREAAERMADQHGCLSRWNRADDQLGVTLRPGLRVLARKIDGACGVAVALELRAKQVPAPGAVICAMDEGEVHSRRLVDALQDDHRDLARGLLPVVVEARVDVGVLRVQALVLVALRNVRAGLELLIPHLDDHLGVLHQVVVPGRVRGCTAFGGGDHVVVSVASVDERVLANVTRLRAFGREDQHVLAQEWSGRCLSVGPQVLDQVTVEILKSCAHPRWYRLKRRIHSVSYSRWR